MTPDLELILAEGAGMQPGYTTQKVREKCRRCKLGQVSIAGTIKMISSYWNLLLYKINAFLTFIQGHLWRG